MAFLVFRTAADPRFVDRTLDPSDRKAGTTRGSARASNYGVIHTGRICSLRSWLSQWSVRLSRADGPTLPGAHPRAGAFLDLQRGPGGVSEPGRPIQRRRSRPFNAHALKGATHHMHGQPDLIERLSDLLVDWAKGLR